RTNWAFGISDEAAFVTAVLEGQPTPPAYFGMMKRINTLGADVLGRRGPTVQLAARGFADAVAGGAVLDVRRAASWASGHLRGTLNIPLIKAFTTWAGWLLDYDRPIVLVADTQTEADAARLALASIGLDRVQGWLDASQAMAAFPDRVAATRRGDIADAEAIAAAGRQVLDLREPNEWQAGHLPMASHHPLGTLRRTLDAMPRTTPLAIHCQAGTRSAIGASVLEAMGFSDVIDLSAGYAGWVATGHARAGSVA
ncbi:MAG: rhodanese-like domain-containing protein, partial [Phycisphaerales bacterium]